MAYIHFYPSSGILHCSMLYVMGTQIDVLIVNQDKSLCVKLWMDFERELKYFENMMSIYIPGGELYKINSSGKNIDIYPSEPLWNILKECFGYYPKTEFLFDITLGNSKNINVDYEKCSIRFLKDNVYIDLGGYGKGLVLERLKKRAMEYGVESLFANFGNSSILGLGHHPCGDSWYVSTLNPFNGDTLDKFELKDSVLTVSGNSPSHTQHIINPISKEYVSARRIVSIQNNNAVEGEILSTTGMLTSKDQFERIISGFENAKGKITEL